MEFFLGRNKKNCKRGSSRILSGASSRKDPLCRLTQYSWNRFSWRGSFNNFNILQIKFKKYDYLAIRLLTDIHHHSIFRYLVDFWRRNGEYTNTNRGSFLQHTKERILAEAWPLRKDPFRRTIPCRGSLDIYLVFLFLHDEPREDPVSILITLYDL